MPEFKYKFPLGSHVQTDLGDTGILFSVEKVSDDAAPRYFVRGHGWQSWWPEAMLELADKPGEAE